MGIRLREFKNRLWAAWSVLKTGNFSHGEIIFKNGGTIDKVIIRDCVVVVPSNIGNATMTGCDLYCSRFTTPKKKCSHFRKHRLYRAIGRPCPCLRV